MLGVLGYVLGFGKGMWYCFQQELHATIGKLFRCECLFCTCLGDALTLHCHIAGVGCSRENYKPLFKQW